MEPTELAVRMVLVGQVDLLVQTELMVRQVQVVLQERMVHPEQTVLMELQDQAVLQE